MKNECKHCMGKPKQNEIGEWIAYCEETASWMNITLGDCFGNCEGQETEDFEEPRKGQLFMREEVDVNKLIAEFSDMAGRCSLMTGDVAQEDLLIQIIGTIVKVAMGR